ncbi:MAG: hypothetical protein Q7O66_11615, partial [Dehalococcoidia bacterium]|nr:hypothetical protein [Dehalococcoidia bacterium]
SPQLPTWLSQHSAPRTPEGSSALPSLQVLTVPSMAFAQSCQARLPLGRPSTEGRGVHDAAGFTSCYGLLSWSDIALTLGLLLTSDGSYRAA